MLIFKRRKRDATPGEDAGLILHEGYEGVEH